MKTGTVLITGTSSGIGRAAAKYFQQRNWNVIATMRDPDKETELAALDHVLVQHLDVTDAGSIQAAVAAGLDRYGTLDVLVNNAGFGTYGPLEATSMDQIRRQFETNVIGLLATTKAALPVFRRNRSGVIVNVSSMGGKISFPLGTLYHGTKFAVEGLSEALHFELKGLGVQVKIIEPGNVKTDFGGRSLEFVNDETLTEYQETVRKVMAGFTSFSAMSGEASEVAEVIYRAATDGAEQLRYMSGADATALIGQRKAQDDDTFLQGIVTQFGLQEVLNV